MDGMIDLDTRIANFLENADLPSINLGNLVANAREMDLATATAISIAQADPQKATEFVSLLAKFLVGITPDSDGMVVADGHVAAQLLGRLGFRRRRHFPPLNIASNSTATITTYCGGSP